MFSKNKLSKLLLGLVVGIFLIPVNGFALDTPVTINGKCVSRILSFTANKAKPENGVLVTPSNGYVNIYVLNGSDFSYSVQDVSGILAKSPSQAFYYDYRASTIIPGNYAGYDFAGNTSYLSMGSASLFFGSDTSYTCNGGPGTVLGGNSLLKSYNVTVSISSPGINAGVTPTGTGYYKEGSQVTVSVPNISGYVFDKWTGSCNAQSIVLNNYSTKTAYTYTVTNLHDTCALVANYVKQEQVFTTLFHNIKLTTTGGGYVTLSGANSATTTGSSVAFSIRNGDTVSYSATANSGYTFNGWSGDLLGSAQSGAILSDRDKSASAIFTPNTLNNSSTTCVDVPSNITVTTYPKGAGGLEIFYPGHITSSADVTLTALNLGPSYSGGNGNSCANGYQIVPKAWSGYEFTGWSGDVNTATGTISNLNLYNRLYKGDWVNGGYTITANFQYTGEENANGNPPDSVDEPTYVAQNDSVAKLFEFNQGTVSRSPFSIDNKCVNRVLTFNGTRVFSLGIFGLNVSISYPHIYTIYSLEGSALTQNQDGSLITFKSAPSNFVYSYDKPAISSGNYQSSNQSYFNDTADSLTFKNFTDIRFQAYSCVNGTENFSVEPITFTPDTLALSLQGFSYAINTDSQLYNVATGTVNGLTAEPYRHINNFEPSVLNASTYTAVDCTLAHNTFGSVDLGCPAWISDSYNYYVNKYRYMWVFSTKPIKNYLHQEENVVGGCKDGDIICNSATTTVRSLYAYDPDTVGLIATGTLKNPFYDTVDNQVGIYATRIDLSLCHKYFGTGAYRSKIWAFISSISGNSTECNDIRKPRYLNDFVFESTTDTNTVYIFGVLMTSIGTDYSKWSSDRISVELLGSPIITNYASSTEPGNSQKPTGANKVTEDNADILPPYSSDTYSADVNTTLPGKEGYTAGYNSAISDVSAYIDSEYNINKCFSYGYTTGLLQGFGCIISNVFMSLLSKVFVPSVNDIQQLQKSIMGAGDNGSIVTAFLTIPLRFAKWADLSWYPNWQYSNYASSTFVYTPGYNVYTATTSINGYTETVPGYYQYVATSTTNVTATTTFTSTGTYISPTSQTVRVFIVGGGGGTDGGGFYQGGGGGGEVLDTTTSISGTSYTVTIGSGGVGQNNGGDSTFSSITARGGKYGRGSASNPSGGNSGNGHTGAGSCTNSNYGCGGGGDSANASSQNGGNGTNSSVTGSSLCYGGGGNGSGYFSSGSNNSCRFTANSGSGANGTGQGTGSLTGYSGYALIVGLQASTTPGYYQYVATSTVYHATSTVAGFFTYVATSTTNGTFVKSFNTGTGTMPYLSVGFSSTTKVYIEPATVNDYRTAKFALADKMLADYLAPFISFLFTLFVSWKVYKLIVL